jgi:pilus assembly protein CpaF
MIQTTPSATTTDTARALHPVDPAEHDFQKIKALLHEQLVESLDLSRLGQVDQQELWGEIKTFADRLCNTRPEIRKRNDRERLLNELMDEMFGLGPLEKLMHEPDVTDVLVNHPHEVYVERHGRLELTDVVFADEQHLMRIIQRIVARLGRRIDEVSPMVDARLPDGSRVNAVIPPLALNGPTLSIRRFGARPLEATDLVANGSLPSNVVKFLAAAAEARLSFLISGGTGSGKTTLLNALSASIPADERLISIEDSAELILQHKHVVRMETRPANTEGNGEVTQRDLVRNALRMRPDRILIGEVRGPEALDMLQAMNTGHEGSLTTIHANDTADALSRMEMMVAMTGFDLPVHVVRQYISTAIKLVVHLARLKGGIRRVMRVSEVVGFEDGRYRLEDIFSFKQTGVNADGVAQGHFHTTGYEPQCLQRIHAAGIELPESMFTLQ